MDRDLVESRRIAQAARAVGQLVFAGWTATLRGGIATGIEAQIAAAALGHKPLYFDPWPEAEARAFAGLIRPALPAGAVCRTSPEGIFIYRPEVLRPIFAKDPGFYRLGQETPWHALRRLTVTGLNGELLGYGARSLLTRGAARVEITGGQRLLFMFFVSEPAKAVAAATARAEDIAAVFDGDVYFHITWPQAS